MPQGAAPAGSGSNGEHHGTGISALEKRDRLGLQVHLEAGGDGIPRVHQMLETGTYIRADDSEYARTCAAASAFVTRTLAERLGTSSAEDGDSSGAAPGSTNAGQSLGPDPKWPHTAFTSVEGALYEVGRIIAIIEALRGTSASQPVLQLMRAPKEIAQRRGKGPDTSVPAATLREAPAMLMAKRRTLASSATMLADRATKLRKWAKDDNEFCDAFLFLRLKACGIRRAYSGAALIDVGDGNFAEVQRLNDKEKESMREGARQARAKAQAREQAAMHENPAAMVDVVATVAGAGADAIQLPLPKRHLVRVHTPPETFLSFGLTRIENDCIPIAAPVFQAHGDGGSSENDCLDAVLRRIRLARVSAFRRTTFDRMMREASKMTDAIDFTTNSISVESGPYDVLRIDRTRCRVAPGLNVGTDLSAPVLANFREIQDASLMQMVIIFHSRHSFFATPPMLKTAAGIFDRALISTCSLSVLRALETVLDEVVDLLGVRVEWSRGIARAEEARVWVWSDSADGDGPDRSLLEIEPLSNVNNSGDPHGSGHVKVTPAFGVIIPAPDDPATRGRGAVLLAQSSSTVPPSPTIGLDDVPRSYVCPVHSGGEIMSAVTLLLCIRLLDALETAARAGDAEVLDVDRQCFVVVVSSPQSGRVLRVKVWPRGETPGKEIPGTTAWFNGEVVEDFPAKSPGRLVAWKKLLRRLLGEDVEGAAARGGGSLMSSPSAGPGRVGPAGSPNGARGQRGAVRGVGRAGRGGVNNQQARARNSQGVHPGLMALQQQQHQLGLDGNANGHQFY